jgi:hypothetical protein
MGPIYITSTNYPFINKIYEFMTKVFQYKYHRSGHCPSSCILSKTYNGCSYLTGNTLRLRY